MKQINVINLVVNWLNDIQAIDEVRIIPTVIAFNFGTWLNNQNVLKDEADLPKRLFERPDLEEFMKKDAEQMKNLMNTLTSCCVLHNDMEISKEKNLDDKI